jgi:hypothetical protein
VNFARSNSEAGQQIYMAASVGNDPLRWMAVNGDTSTVGRTTTASFQLVVAGH